MHTPHGHTPRRVVSLSPNVSMMLFALGADEVVVGRTQDCLPAIQQYLTVWRIPEPTVAQRLQHWQALPVVGTWPLADREAIQALQPERILTSGSGLLASMRPRRLGWRPRRCTTSIPGPWTTWSSTCSRSACCSAKRRKPHA